LKIAILTNFMEFNPGYSLTGIVQDQAEMLVRFGHQVAVFVNEKYSGPECIAGAPVLQLVPFAHLADYQSIDELSPVHQLTVRTTSAMLMHELADYDVVFTHDFMFTGWFLPYGLACVEASKKLRCAWMHWIHSIPSVSRDWWKVREWGDKHVLIYPNETDRLRVAEQYKGWPHNVRVIPHIKDLRTWMDFSDETRLMIDQVPGILQADVVQLLPASVDRLTSKRVAEVIRMFASFKHAGRSVCLVVANQWATTRTHRENVAKYLSAAADCGLVPGQDVVFTSEIAPEYEKGISRRMIRELFACSNVFIFPTREESFGLVVPEACLAGVLPVLNKSLAMQVEISGYHALYFDFGSYCHNFQPLDPDAYLYQVAMIILARMAQDESIKMKTYCRQRYNMDAVYHQYYAPVMAAICGINDAGRGAVPCGRKEAV
jgi:hypothetical protein